MIDYGRLILISAIVVPLTAIAVSATSLAQSDDEPEPSAPATSSGGASKSEAGKKGSKRTTINFEDQLIEGRTQKPELFVLLQNRMNNSRRLFKLRENFLPEIRKTGEDVGRAESNVRGSAEPAK